MPISDNIQAAIMLACGIMIAIGATQIPATTPNHDTIATIFILIGAIGMAIKEKLGAAVTSVLPTPNPTPTPTPQPQQPQNPTDTSNFTPDS